MSNYRDDTNEIVVVSDSTWGGQSTIAEDFVRVADELVFRLRVLHVETITVSDEAPGFPGSIISESVQVADLVLDKLHAANLVVDDIKVADTTTGNLRAMLVETVHVSDQVLDTIRQVITETVHVSDQVLDKRHVTVLVEESIKVSDQSWQAARVLVLETITATDELFGAKHARSLVEDFVHVADEIVDSHKGVAEIIIETVRIADQAFGTNHAVQLVVESVEVGDQVVGQGVTSQAWTANVRTWAMSRYAPYSFIGLAVIDGKLYGMADDGVYALGTTGEVIQGEIRTGKLDVSSGVLATPHAAYLEYELDGTAEIDVTTTQSGAAETYTYGLPPELAGELTNGRFVFGRGLRGRHFTFALRMTGTHGYINDLSVTTAQTKRRV